MVDVNIMALQYLTLRYYRVALIALLIVKFLIGQLGRHALAVVADRVLTRGLER